MKHDNYWTTVFKKRLSRRLFLRATAGVGSAYAFISLAGCGGEKASPEASGKSKTPKYGGVFNWSNTGQLTDLDPFDNSEGGTVQRGAVGVIYDHLVVYDWSGDRTSADGDIVPRLAESWTMPDDTTYVFKMRQGVQWHDGAEFTSGDVKYTYEFIMDKANAAPGRSSLTAVGKIEAPDKDTIKLTLKDPTAGFLSALTSFSLPITPRHVLEKGRREIALNPVGTGPFMVEKFDHNIKVYYKKNPYYYVKGKPYLDGMTIALIDDESSRNAAVLAKEVDIQILNDRAQYEAIKAAMPNVQLRAWPGVSNVTLFFNFTRPPFTDRRARRAVLLAIDQKGMMDRIFNGEGSINPPVLAGVWKKWAIPQDELLKMPGFRQPKAEDIAEAKRLLAEAGYPNGLTVTAICDATLTAAKNLLVAADHLRAVGITVSLECTDRGIFGKRNAAGDFDIVNRSFGGYTEDPDRRLFGFVHSKGSSNSGKLNDPKLDEMIERQSRTLEEQDRRKVLLDIQRYIIEQAYNVPTPNALYYGIMQPYLRGYDPAYMGVGKADVRGEAEDIWLDK